MPKFPFALGGGKTLTLDTDDTVGSVQALQSHIDETKKLAVTPVEADRDAFRDLAVDDLVARKALAVGSGFDAEAYRAHLVTLSASQLAYEGKQVPTKLAASGDGKPDGDGTPEADGKPDGDGNPKPDPKPVDTTASPAVTALSAKAKSGNPFAPIKKVAAVLALFLLLASGAHASAFTGPVDVDVVEVLVDELDVALVASELGFVAEADATPEAARHELVEADGLSPVDRQKPDRSPLGSLLLSVVSAVGFVGLTVYDRIRSAIGNCKTGVVTAGAGGLLGGFWTQFGQLWGIVYEDTDEGETVVAVYETDDAGAEMPKAAVAFASGGLPVYYDEDGDPVGGVAGSGALTNVDGGGANDQVGYTVEAAAAGDELVRLRIVQ